MVQAERVYLDALDRVRVEGEDRQDRTGVGTRSLFGLHLDFGDVSEAFPVLTTKKVFWKGVVAELLWFIGGNTNVKPLQERGVHIWDEWRSPFIPRRDSVRVRRREAPPKVPYKGDFSKAGGPLADTWRNMMRRCYDPNHDRYEVYGGSGAFVAEEWHSFKTFEEQVKCLPQWVRKQENWSEYELDKDYYGTKAYSPTTAVWLHRTENTPSSEVSKNGIVVSTPEGEEMLFHSLPAASSELSASISSLHRFVTEGIPSILKGNNKKFKGWNFRYVTKEDGFVVRPKLQEDGDLGPIYGAQWKGQLAGVIESIKKDPHSRRHLVNAWSHMELDFMALPPCHYAFQFYVDGDDRLSLMWQQRSADMFLGLPFNIASYALLLHIVGHLTNKRPRRLAVTLGDAHIYNNHIDQVNEQLQRERRPLPRLKFSERAAAGTFIDDFALGALEPSDFMLTDYNPHPTIKAPIAK